jgi:hypothetical protein
MSEHIAPASLAERHRSREEHLCPAKSGSQWQVFENFERLYTCVPQSARATKVCGLPPVFVGTTMLVVGSVGRKIIVEIPSSCRGAQSKRSDLLGPNYSLRHVGGLGSRSKFIIDAFLSR